MSTKRLLKPEEYTVAWLCALPLSEAVAAWAMLDEEHEELPQNENDDNTYTYGSIRGHNVVIACMPPGQPGKVSASRLVQSLPTSFPNLRIQLFVGIGGGIPCDPPTKDSRQDIHLGDVVVGWADETGAPAVVQYDSVRINGQIKQLLSVMDKPNRRLLSALGKMLTDRVKGKDFFYSHLERFTKAGVKGFGHPGAVKDRLYQSDYKHAGSDTCDDCDNTRVVKREVREHPMFHQGTIASGDTVVKDSQLREEIRQQCCGAKCVEMEAAGVVDQTHCLVIRGIADYADSHKNQKWQPYAAGTAAAFAREFLLTIQPPTVAEMELVQMQINDMAENEERLRILKWLSSLDFGTRLSEMLDRRQEGTGSWLLESQPFTSWLKGDIRAIWCPGMPGAGKTILASTIIEYLRITFKDTVEVGIAYIYCIYNEIGQTVNNFLASLLQQLCRQKGPLRPDIVGSYTHHSRFDTRPAISELSRLLQSQIQSFAKVYIVVDALDECSESGSTRERLLAELVDLPSEVRLLVTSRPNSAIEQLFVEAECLEISAHEDDMRRHLAARIASESLLMRHIAADPSLRDTIITKVIEKAGGMFLLAELHIDSLSSENNRRHLRRALETLPEKLDDTYDRTWQRIQSQSRSKVDCANQILSWVIFAQRPIGLEELRCALAVELQDSYLDEEALPERGYLLSVCGGLIVISEDKETVRFIHYTTQEYFQRTAHPGFSSAQAYLASICITYLSFSTFASGPCIFPNFAPVGERLRKNVLLGYASQYWGDHIRECHNQDPAIPAMATKFLTRKTNVSCSIEAAGDHRFMSQLPFPKDVTDLHVAAAFGLEWLTEVLLQQGANVDARDSNGRTPLHNAAAGGHLNIIKILFGRGANLKAWETWRKDAMQLAAQAGHEPATRWLLNEHVSLYNIKAAMSEAACNGHCGVLRLVLDRLKDSGNRAQCVGSAIIAASRNGNEASVQLLLDEVADLDMLELQGDLNEALYEALNYGHLVGVQLLLDFGADLNTDTYDDNETLLHRVARWGSVTAAEYLLDHGANIEAINAKGDRPIHKSIRKIHPSEGMFKLLLERGADINVYGSAREPPLITVSKQGKVKSVQLLLDRGADTLAKDEKFDRSAVEWAALNGHPQVVQLLLASQQTVEISERLLALSQLYQALQPNTIDLSDIRNLEVKDLDLRVPEIQIPDLGNSVGDPDSEEDPSNLKPDTIEDNNQLLSIINKFQGEGLKRLLLLHLPASKGDETVVRTFINMGADVDALSDEGDTAMHKAAAKGHIVILELLLDHGANIDSQDNRRSVLTLEYENMPVQVCIGFKSRP